MKAIILNEYGETLLPYDVATEFDPEASFGRTDRHSCGGWCDYKTVSSTHMAIACRSCNGRFLFPRTIKTYAELANHFVEVRRVAL